MAYYAVQKRLYRGDGYKGFSTALKVPVGLVLHGGVTKCFVNELLTFFTRKCWPCKLKFPQRHQFWSSISSGEILIEVFVCRDISSLGFWLKPIPRRIKLNCLERSPLTFRLLLSLLHYPVQGIFDYLDELELLGLETLCYIFVITVWYSRTGTPVTGVSDLPCTGFHLSYFRLAVVWFPGWAPLKGWSTVDRFRGGGCIILLLSNRLQVYILWDSAEWSVLNREWPGDLIQCCHDVSYNINADAWLRDELFCSQGKSMNTNTSRQGPYSPRCCKTYLSLYSKTPRASSVFPIQKRKNRWKFFPSMREDSHFSWQLSCYYCITINTKYHGRWKTNIANSYKSLHFY